MSSSVAAVKALGWDELQALFAATYVDEIAAVQRRGGTALVREKIAALSAGERRVLSTSIALLEADDQPPSDPRSSAPATDHDAGDLRSA